MEPRFSLLLGEGEVLHGLLEGRHAHDRHCSIGAHDGHDEEGEDVDHGLVKAEEEALDGSVDDVDDEERQEAEERGVQGAHTAVDVQRIAAVVPQLDVEELLEEEGCDVLQGFL